MKKGKREMNGKKMIKTSTEPPLVRRCHSLMLCPCKRRRKTWLSMHRMSFGKRKKEVI
jgi:hypothetical protein